MCIHAHIHGGSGGCCVYFTFLVSQSLHTVKCTDSFMNFDIYTYLCNHHPSQNAGYLYLRKYFCSPFWTVFSRTTILIWITIG